MQVKAGLGVQVESYKETSSNAVFGSGTREQREKVYQDAESEKTYFGRLSPGPCTYDAKVICMPLVMCLMLTWSWSSQCLLHNVVGGG